MSLQRSVVIFMLVVSMLVVACAAGPGGVLAEDPPRDAATADERALGAGFRFSTYGPDRDPGPGYWADVGRRMAGRFPGSVPEAIWIVGRLEGEGTFFNFPADTENPLIQTSEADGNEEILTLFDRVGLRVWLQVEPGNAPVDELIHLMLDRYGHHSCVVGVGVDVEWYRSVERPEGEPVSDELATAWLAAARSHDPGYRLFLKHWEIGMMPPTVRDGLFFVDDSQILPSLDAMVEEFAEWGRAFAPAPVGFQYGYESDRHWWEKLADPPAEIGRRILASVPNAAGLYWVDFTVLEVFPPAAPSEGPQGVTAELPVPEITAPEVMVGVKIYDYQGRFEELFAEWAALGINTAFVSESLAADAGFRERASSHGIDVFLIAPVFFNPEVLEQDPELFAITADGGRGEDDWVQFTCPSRRRYRERRVAELADLVARLRPDGLSVDFIRHFVFWEMVGPETRPEELPNSCFCSHCVAAFEEATGVAIPQPSSDVAVTARWILENHEAQWTDWKVQLITSMVQEITEKVRAVDPDLRINIHAVPWRREDYSGAIRRVAGQDFAALSPLADYLSPMAYSFMLERPPEWIHSVVEDLAAVSAAGVVPSIQVREAYREDQKFSVDEFARCLREALRPPSRGVVFWSWDALAQEPEKRDVVRREIERLGLAPAIARASAAPPS